MRRAPTTSEKDRLENSEMLVVARRPHSEALCPAPRQPEVRRGWFCPQHYAARRERRRRDAEPAVNVLAASNAGDATITTARHAFHAAEAAGAAPPSSRLRRNLPVRRVHDQVLRRLTDKRRRRPAGKISQNRIINSFVRSATRTGFSSDGLRDRPINAQFSTKCSASGPIEPLLADENRYSSPSTALIRCL